MIFFKSKYFALLVFVSSSVLMADYTFGQQAEKISETTTGFYTSNESINLNPYFGVKVDADLDEDIVLEDNPLCESRTAYLQGRIRQGIGYRDLLRELPKQGRQLVVFAEEHKKVIQDNYPRFLEQLKESMPDLNCLFLEASVDLQPSLDAISDGIKIDYSFKSQLAIWHLWDGLVASEKVPEKSTIGGYVGTIVKANFKKLKVFAVDHPKAVDFKWAQATKNLDTRDKYMSEKIQSLQKSDCEQGLLIVGAAHVSADVENRKTLGDRLRENNEDLPVTIIRMQSTSAANQEKSSPRTFSWDWPMCPVAVEELRNLRVFKPEIPPEGVSIWAHGKGNWTDYDYVIAFPETIRPGDWRTW